MMIVWDVESGKALYGAPNRDPVNQIKFFNNSEDKIIAVLDNGVQIFTVDKANKKVRKIPTLRLEGRGDGNKTELIN